MEVLCVIAGAVAVAVASSMLFGSPSGNPGVAGFLAALGSSALIVGSVSGGIRLARRSEGPGDDCES